MEGEAHLKCLHLMEFLDNDGNLFYITEIYPSKSLIYINESEIFGCMSIAYKMSAN